MTHRRASPVRIALVAAFLAACATTPPGGASRFDFFSAPAPERDVWYEKVEAWQRRAEQDRITISAASAGSHGAGLIRLEVARFRDGEQHGLARRINAWTQAAARRHYRIEADVDPSKDHWPTFRELLDRNGDDCDGLDLMTYELLREFGFIDVYRAIVRRDRDGGNHMVTLWFESRDDPWVLDATGAITIPMRRFSELPIGWTPTTVFSESEQFSVVSHGSFAIRE